MHPTKAQLDSALCKKAWKREVVNKSASEGSGECFDRKGTKKSLGFFPKVKSGINTKNKIYA